MGGGGPMGGGPGPGGRGMGGGPGPGGRGMGGGPGPGGRDMDRSRPMRHDDRPPPMDAVPPLGGGMGGGGMPDVAAIQNALAMQQRQQQVRVRGVLEGRTRGSDISALIIDGGV